MATHLYSLDRVAELLNLHVKTVRSYVRSGRLKAKRIGKQYRITGEALEEFTGAAPLEPRPSVPRRRYVIASSIIDADVVSPPTAERITTMVMAGLNARSDEEQAPRVDVIYFPEQARLRVTITATPQVAAGLIRVVAAILEDNP